MIGPGGKHIQELQKETETVITIEEIEGEKGKVTISSANGDNLAIAKRIIKEMTAKPEIGGEYDAVVKKVVEFGVFVEFMPGHQGLVHISEISHSRIDKVEGVLKEGDEIKVKIVGVDKKSGKMRLSRKALLPAPEKTSEASAE